MKIPNSYKCDNCGRDEMFCSIDLTDILAEIGSDPKSEVGINDILYVYCWTCHHIGTIINK